MRKLRFKTKREAKHYRDTHTLAGSTLRKKRATEHGKSKWVLVVESKKEAWKHFQPR
jgi:hypothetical protein